MPNLRALQISKKHIDRTHCAIFAQPGDRHTCTTKNLQIVWSNQKNPYLNHAI